MKKGSFLLMGLGYVAGLLVALKFSKDGKDKNFSELATDIKAVHMNLWTNAEEKIFSEENREKIAEMKAKALREIEDFRDEAEVRMRALVKKGELKKDEIMEELQNMYDKRAEILDDLLDEGQKYADKIGSTSEEVGTRLSKKVDTIRKDLKKELSDNYKKIKKNIG